jgi:hypothetical protein
VTCSSSAMPAEVRAAVNELLALVMPVLRLHYESPLLTNEERAAHLYERLKLIAKWLKDSNQ